MKATIKPGATVWTDRSDVKIWPADFNLPCDTVFELHKAGVRYECRATGVRPLLVLPRYLNLVPTFARGDVVRKKSGSQWEGTVVGEYSTALTPEGYAVESYAHPGSVQIYPVSALELVMAAGEQEP